MSDFYTDDDIIYERVRDHSPQWLTSAKGRRHVALVTERWVKEPPYVVRPLDAHGNEGPEEEYATRDEVAERVTELVNEEARA